MHAFILAGGFATRLWPLTEKRAKPLLPLAGKPIISYLVEKIPEGMPITVSTNDTFREGFDKWKRETGRPNLEILIEDARHDDHKLGALGAVRRWIIDQRIDEDIVLLTGDNYCGFSLRDFIGAFDGRTVLLAANDIGDLEKAKAFGTVLLGQETADGMEALPDSRSARSPVAREIPGNDSGNFFERGNGAGARRVVREGVMQRFLIGFEEKPSRPKSTLVSTGCSILPRATLSILTAYAQEHPDNVGGIFEEFLRRRIPVRCFTFAEPWFDIGSFSAYLAATRALVGENVLLGERAVCEASRCAGSVVIGRHSAVARSKLENVVLFEDCEVIDCELEDCILDRDCRLIGVDLRGKMLREGTVLVSKQ